MPKPYVYCLRCGQRVTVSDFSRSLRNVARAKKRLARLHQGCEGTIMFQGVSPPPQEGPPAFDVAPGSTI